MQHSENARVHISSAASPPKHISNYQFMSVSRTSSSQEINSLVTWKIKHAAVISKRLLQFWQDVRVIINNCVFIKIYTSSK